MYFISRKYFASGIFLKISKTIYYQEEIEIQIRNQNKNQAKIQSNLIEECVGVESICKIEKKQVADALFSIEKAYQEAKNSDNMAAFCEALSKVKLKKDDVYNDGFKHNEYMNDKTIFCCCITEAKGFELSINGPSGAMYRYTDNSYENVRYLEIF